MRFSTVFKFRLGLLLVLGSALLAPAACTPVGPDYHPPQPSMPTQWDEGTGVDGGPAATYARWWSLFHDPLLDELIGRAVVANPDLKIAETRVREARALYRQAASGLLPSVDAGASYSGSRESKHKSDDAKTTDLFQVQFDVNWEIDVFGSVRRQTEAAEANLAATMEDHRAVLVSLVAEVARNYVELRAYQQRLAIARENSRSQEQTVDLVRNKFHLGLGNELEVAQAETLLAQTRAEMPALESGAVQAMHQLALLLGRQPQTLKAELSVAGATPPVPPHLPLSLPSELLRQRPDIRSAERQLAAATANVGVATADLFPRFSLAALIGLQNSSLSDLVSSSSHFWLVGPAINWSLFDGGRRRAVVEASEAQRQRAELTYEKTVLTALAETENALVALNRERETYEMLKTAVDASQRATFIARGLYKAGLTPFLNVLQSENALYQSQDKQAQSGQRLAVDMIALYKALGGGWHFPPASAPTSSGTDAKPLARNIP
ncbi:efflux transporter outer membrane subunit [Desulfobulbus sp.]|uniref:efflux transporter outer membrane subunit n=1 Tax=Desulfobulbus sp. TaxID=895 RepID=UPI00286F532E|nr:efflux transporter outer membrane subunit [Desulfobulbus sp.]